MFLYRTGIKFRALASVKITSTEFLLVSTECQRIQEDTLKADYGIHFGQMVCHSCLSTSHLCFYYL